MHLEMTKQNLAALERKLNDGQIPDTSVRECAVDLLRAIRDRNGLEGTARQKGVGNDRRVRARLDGLDALAEELWAGAQKALEDPQDSRPVYRTPRDTLYGTGRGWTGTDGMTSVSSPWSAKSIGHGERLADRHGLTEHPFGALGVLAKSLTGTADPSETAHFLDGLPGVKDMVSSGGAAVLVPAQIASFVIDLLRARTVVSQLGARTVPMSSKSLPIPRVTADPTPEWLAEGATSTPSDGNLDSVDLEAKRLTSIVKFSDELDEDSDPELAGEVLANSLARSFAAELDRVALRGSGVGAEPRGVLNQAGVGTVPAVGAADYTTFTGFRTTLLGANSECTGFVTSPRTLGAIEDTPASDGHFIAAPDSLANIPRMATSAVPVDLGAGTNESEIYAGSWAELIIGVRVNFELRRLSERYAEEGKVALRARLRADIALAHGASFVVGTGVTS